MDSEARAQFRLALVAALDLDSCRHHDVVDGACAHCLADAVLDLVDVDEEFGLTWPPTGDVDWFDSEDQARAVVLLPQPPELSALCDPNRLVRRFLLTTKPVPVPTQKENTPDGQ